MLFCFQGSEARVRSKKEISRLNCGQQALDIQQFGKEEGSEIKWEGDDPV